MNKTKISNRLVHGLIVALLILLLASAVGCSYLSGDINVGINYDAEEVVIKYETNGGTPINDRTINLLHEHVLPAPPTPEKAGYNFEGWYEDPNLKYPFIYRDTYLTSMTLYAKWSPRFHNISLVTNGGNVETMTQYDNSVDTQLPIPTKEGFCFAGWYTDSAMMSNNISVIPAKTTGNKVYYAKWINGDYALVLNRNGGVCADIANAKFNETYTLPIDITRDGYTFEGWYTTENFDGESIGGITNESNSLINVYAKWKQKSYKITLYDAPNASSPLCEKSYKFGEKIELPTLEPARRMTFDGWYTDKNLSKKFILEEMPNHDVVLYAKYIPCINVTLSSYGETIMTTPVFNGKYYLIDIVASEYNKPDFEFGGWYTDNTYTTPYDSNKKLEDDTVIYAKWIPYGFFRYDKEWNTTIERSERIHIKNKRELSAFTEYFLIKGYDKLPFVLDYMTNGTNDEIQNEVYDVAKKSQYHNAYLVYCTYDYDLNSYVLVRPQNYIREGFVSADPEGKKLLKIGKTSIDPPKITNKRPDDFDDFKYQKYEMSYDVKYSDELFYALSFGVKPIPKANSPAESLLNKSKDILRQICDDNMSDLQKMYAIYYWIANNIRYDNKAVKQNDTLKLDAWALEGPLNMKTGVCDSISMLYVVLARLEGITTIEKCGADLNGKNRHAWNKAYLDGNGDGRKEWYVIDATWSYTTTTADGSVWHSDDTSYMVNNKFLFTDEERLNDDEYVEDDTSTYFVKTNATTDIKKGENIYFGNVMDENHNLRIHSMTELLYLFDYVIETNIDNTEKKGFCIDVFFDNDFSFILNFYGLYNYRQSIEAKYNKELDIYIHPNSTLNDTAVITFVLSNL